LRLAYEILVLLSVFGQHVVEDLQEAAVLSERVWRGRDGSRCAYCEVVVWRFGVEVGEDIGTGVGSVWKGFLAEAL
jgi:hypothetical protein